MMKAVREKKMPVMDGKIAWTDYSAFAGIRTVCAAQAIFHIDHCWIGSGWYQAKESREGN